MSATTGPGAVHGPSDWFLTAAERGNPSTAIDAGREPDAWTVGNRVEPLIHGADYFAHLAACIAETREGDSSSSRTGVVMRTSSWGPRGRGSAISSRLRLGEA